MTRAVLDAVLHERLTEVRDELVERMRDMQTEIIRVFMEFQQRNENRDTAIEKSIPPLTERMASMERRLLEIERSCC